jgi:hypothetical protein
MVATLATICALCTPQVSLAQHIEDISYDVTPRRAKWLAKVIKYEAAKKDIDPFLVAAILMQESAFHTGVISETDDVGIAQINWATWNKELRLNRNLLETDDYYGIVMAIKVLVKMRKQYEEKDPCLWWSTYHSATPKYRHRYENFVIPYLPAECRQCPVTPEVATSTIDASPR